ncbi:MAG: hypothetical protein IJA52_09270 [Clostridia bacterium]|nr:hypothetical protein [Bacillota bacterium]MBQ3528727.1 hypothetical protein [Clostridia bacterium]
MNNLGNENGYNPSNIKASESFVYYPVKAKYVHLPSGEFKLLSVQEFSAPLFRKPGYEEIVKDRYIDDFSDTQLTIEERETVMDNVCRAVHRAKIQCFDLIQCNPDLDTFVTITFNKNRVDRTSYDDIYDILKVWLSNRVSRCGLCYVLVPEYHHDKESIHFHGLFNSAALKLVKARSPKTGRLLHTMIGKQIYNIEDFTAGFTTAVMIDGESCVDKVSKYIFKYMGKQLGQKIGGRYYLHGGKLALPYFMYGQDPAEFVNGEICTYDTEPVQVLDNLTFRQYFYI